MVAQLGRGMRGGGDPRWAALERAAHGSCDLDATLRFETALLRVGALSDLLRDSTDYRERCGTGAPALGTLRYQAFEALGAHGQAAAEASGLIASDRNNPDYLVMRGRVWIALGNHRAAATDLGEAFELAPKRRDLPGPLADELVAVGQPCQAVGVIEDATFHWSHEDQADDRSDDPELHRLRRYMLRLNHAAHCGRDTICEDGPCRDPDDVE
jgi:hypothetical protein